MPNARCEYCQYPVNVEAAGVAELVQGYRVNRGKSAQGGTNAIALPIPLGRWLCPACLDVAKGKASAGQGELF